MVQKIIHAEENKLSETAGRSEPMDDLYKEKRGCRRPEGEPQNIASDNHYLKETADAKGSKIKKNCGRPEN